MKKRKKEFFFGTTLEDQGTTRVVRHHCTAIFHCHCHWHCCSCCCSCCHCHYFCCHHCHCCCFKCHEVAQHWRGSGSHCFVVIVVHVVSVVVIVVIVVTVVCCLLLLLLLLLSLFSVVVCIFVLIVMNDQRKWNFKGCPTLERQWLWIIIAILLSMQQFPLSFVCQCCHCKLWSLVPCRIFSKIPCPSLLISLSHWLWNDCFMCLSANDVVIPMMSSKIVHSVVTRWIILAMECDLCQLQNLLWGSKGDTITQ